MTPTVAEINQKRADVAALSREQLTGKTVAELKALAKGVLPKVSGLRKAQLVAQLIAATQSERELMQDDREAVSSVREKSEDLAEFAQRFYDEFRDIVRTAKEKKQSYESLVGRVTGLAVRLVDWLKSQPGNQANGGQAVTTILRNRTTVMSSLKESITADTGIYSQVLSDCYGVLSSAVSEALGESTRRKNLGYKAQVSERGMSAARVDVDAAELLRMANDVLSDLDNLDAPAWRKVVFCLVLVTGRRPVEVQCTAELSPVDDYTVNFTGQTKVKGKAGEFYGLYPGYDIPTLAPAETVIAAFSWLESHGKRIDKSIEDAESKTHRKYSKALSQYTQSLRSAELIPDSFTLKSARSVYAQVCTHVAEPGDKESYVAQILGHGRAHAVETGCYYDPETPKSYEADWNIKGLNTPLLGGLVGHKGFVHDPRFYKR